MPFRQLQMRLALVLVLGGLSVGCNSPADGDWVEVESYGDSALYLDTASVTGGSQRRIFKTKLATPGWRSLFSKAEIRNTYQIDCNAKTLRKLEGGIYENGRLKHPHEKLSSGKVGTRGHEKLLYDRVCP